MRLLLANGSAYPRIGGVENSLRFIGRELVRAGHEVKLFCFQTASNEPLRLEHEGIEIRRCPLPPIRWPHTRMWAEVATVQNAIGPILEGFQPDAVWSRSARVALGIRRGGYSGALVHIFSTNARMDCCGLHLQTHGMPLRRRLVLAGLWPLAYTASARIERELAPQCTAVAFSENMRQQLLADFPRDARRCQVIRPGVDSELFSPENGARYFAQIEREYGLHPGEPIVLYVGRLSTAKHIPMLMDAVAMLKQPARLVLVGGGPEDARLRAYARRTGLAERVLFAGTQHELLPGFYALARVFVLPTTIESFGQVYLEALACGTPAVGFAGDGRRVLTATAEIIRDGETGAVARTPTASALAEKIGAILSLDDTAYAAMSRRAREDVRERFSWRGFVSETLALTTEH